MTSPRDATTRSVLRVHKGTGAELTDTMASAQLEIPGHLQQRQEEKCGAAVPGTCKAIARAAAAGLVDTAPLLPTTGGADHIMFRKQRMTLPRGPDPSC